MDDYQHRSDLDPWQQEMLWLARIKDAIRQLVAQDQDRAKQLNLDVVSGEPLPVPTRPRQSMPKNNKRGRQNTNRPEGMSDEQWTKNYFRDYHYCNYHGRKLRMTAIEYARHKGITLGLGHRNCATESPPHDEGVASD